MSIPALPEVKAMGKRLAEHLAQKHGVKLKNAAILEALAAQFGYRNWNTLAAVLSPSEGPHNQKTTSCPVAAPVSPFGLNSPLSQNVMVCGATGSGARTFSYQLLEEHLAHGGGALIFDFLDDPSLKVATQKGLARAGRSSALRQLHLDEKHQREAYNPVRTGTPEQIAARILQLLPPDENAGALYYRNSARHALNVVIGALQACHRTITLKTLADLFLHPETLLELERTLQPDTQGKALASLTNWLNAFRNRDLTHLAERPFQEHLGGLLGRLTLLTQGTLGAILNDPAATLSFDTILANNEVLHVTLPVMKRDTLCQRLAALALSDFLDALANRKGVRPTAPFLCLTDNLLSWAPTSLPEALPRMKKEGVILAQHYGGLSPFRAIPDSGLAQALIEHTEHCFVFRQNNAEDALLADAFLKRAVNTAKGTSDALDLSAPGNASELLDLQMGEALHGHRGGISRLRLAS